MLFKLNQNVPQLDSQSMRPCFDFFLSKIRGVRYKPIASQQNWIIYRMGNAIEHFQEYQKIFARKFQGWEFVYRMSMRSESCEKLGDSKVR